MELEHSSSTILAANNIAWILSFKVNDKQMVCVCVCVRRIQCIFIKTLGASSIDLKCMELANA